MLGARKIIIYDFNPSVMFVCLFGFFGWDNLFVLFFCRKMSRF